MDTKYDMSKTIELLYESIEPIRNRFYHQPYSFLSIVGKERSESSHSNFLKWICECKFVGKDDENKAVGLLWKIICDAEKSQHRYDESTEEHKALMATNPRVSLNNVYREFYCGKGRVDIVIDATLQMADIEKPLMIIIENKIDSGENNNQTEEYYKYLSKTIPERLGEANHRKRSMKSSERELQIFVYLTINEDSMLGANLCSCKHYININYSDICRKMLCPLMNLSTIEIRAKNYIREYIDGCSIPSICKNNKSTGKNIIAMSDFDEKMIKEFWENNKDLIIELMRIYPYDEDKGNSDKVKLMHDFADAYRKSCKDLTKYIVAYELPTKQLNKGEATEYVFKTLFQKGRKDDATKCECRDYHGNRAIMPELEYKTMIKKSSSYKNRFKRLESNDGEVWYVSKEWDKNSFGLFIKWAQSFGFTFSLDLNY